MNIIIFLAGLVLFGLLLIEVLSGLKKIELPFETHKLIGYGLLGFTVIHALVGAFALLNIEIGYIMGLLILTLIAVDVLIGIRVIKADVKVHRTIGLVTLGLGSLHLLAGLLKLLGVL